MSFSNKYFHSFLASLFYIGFFYFFFIAATNMNYVWQWTSVPKYFLYEGKQEIVAEFEGVLTQESDQYLLLNEKTQEKIVLEIPSEFVLLYNVGDFIYENDSIAEKKELKAGPILQGLWVTIKVSFFSAILMLIVGILVAFMKLSSHLFLNYIASAYIGVIRGTPLLVQILLFYFIIANIFELSALTAGIISLGLFFGAYSAEIIRGSIVSIHRGQREAAESLGLNYVQTMGLVILPQAFRRALPTLVGEFISLVKDSSLVSVISITDLTKVGREIVANTFSPFETWITIAAVYLTITFSLYFIGSLLESRMKAKGEMA